MSLQKIFESKDPAFVEKLKEISNNFTLQKGALRALTESAKHDARRLLEDNDYKVQENDDIMEFEKLPKQSPLEALTNALFELLGSDVDSVDIVAKGKLPSSVSEEIKEIYEESEGEFELVVTLPKDPSDEPKDPSDEPKDPSDEPKDPSDEPKDPSDEPKDPMQENEKTSEEKKIRDILAAMEKYKKAPEETLKDLIEKADCPKKVREAYEKNDIGFVKAYFKRVKGIDV